MLYSCGNATQGGPYCSPECRKSDLERSEASPDDSPFMSAIPPLISSAKSVCSTPPSSAANSPVHVNGGLDLGEPPALDLPPPKHGIEYGGQSLPHGLRYPSTWTINYQPDLLSSPLVQPNEVQQAKDLRYRRKPGKPQSVVPSPLYFRQKAAARHGSPGFGATSVFNPSMSGLPATTDISGAHIHEDDIASLDLPGQRHADSVSHLLPKPANCGRAGCVGIPKRPKLEQQRSSGRRISGSMSPALRGLAPLDTSDDVLLSPRIRNLRLHHSPSESREVSPLATPADENASAPKEDNEHSAFACYLFSHLSTEAPPEQERGRTTSVSHAAPELLRSRSVDAVLAARHAVHSTANSASPAPTPTRPRAMMGGRNAAINMRSEPAMETTTRGRRSPSPRQAPPVAADKDDTSLFSSNGAELDRDATLRAPNQRGRDRHRMQLTPGHFISATSETPSGVSPFPSPPPSPPTAGRGRSVARRASDAEPVSSVDPRGRSKMRGVGAVQRSQSPSARKNSPSPSRSRSRSGSRSQPRSQSRSRSTSTRSPSRGRVNGLLRGETRSSRESSGGGTSGRRGRTRERAAAATNNDVAPIAPLAAAKANGFTAAHDDDDDDDRHDGDRQDPMEGAYGGGDVREERGRGRSRQVDSRSRSRSKYRRSNGREIIF